MAKTINRRFLRSLFTASALRLHYMKSVCTAIGFQTLLSYYLTVVFDTVLLQFSLQDSRLFFRGVANGIAGRICPLRETACPDLLRFHPILTGMNVYH